MLGFVSPLIRVPTDFPIPRFNVPLVLHMLPDIIDGVETSVNILDSMTHVPTPPGMARHASPRPLSPPVRPLSPMLERCGSTGGLNHSSPLALCKRSPSLGSVVMPRPPPRSHRKGRSPSRDVLSSGNSLVLHVQHLQCYLF